MANSGSRKRRVRMPNGEWFEFEYFILFSNNNIRWEWIRVDESQLEGQTIEHKTKEEIEEEIEQRRLALKNAKYFADTQHIFKKRAYKQSIDPFQLIQSSP